MDFDDLQSTKRYLSMQVYGHSKLANILFTTELARRLQGTRTTANCVHPGTVATGYGRDGDTHGFLAFGLKIIKPFVLTAEKGARTSVYVSSSPEVADISGAYFVKCKQRQPSKAGQDAAAAARLWAVSEELIAAAKPSVGDQ
jgi:retinol dehydrogenase-12